MTQRQIEKAIDKQTDRQRQTETQRQAATEAEAGTREGDARRETREVGERKTERERARKRQRDRGGLSDTQRSTALYCLYQALHPFSHRVLFAADAGGGCRSYCHQLVHALSSWDIPDWFRSATVRGRLGAQRAHQSGKSFDGLW